MNRIRKRNGSAGAGMPRGFARSALCCAIAGGLLLAMAAPASAQDQNEDQEYQETGEIGDPDSWRTDEFLADWGLGAIGAEYAYARGLTGYGINLGIFDSGSVLEHPELAGRGHGAIIIADPGCTNTSNLMGCFYSDGGTAAIDGYLAPAGYVWGESGEALDLEYAAHGTHVAGTMVASRNGDGGMHGVAFGANLTASRLFFNTLNAYYFDEFGNLGASTFTTGPGEAAVLSMYQQMADRGVRAINHSWGFAAEPTTAADMDAFYNAYADFFSVYTEGSTDTGMIQVWSAGNDYGNIAGVHATLPRWVPEAEKYWLAVVNINITGAIDGSSSICGLAADWCIAAPGTNIASSVVGGDIEGEVVVNPDGTVSLDITSEDPQYGYAYYTGTSMAAPHVTGALALLMERYPYLSNPQVRDVMLTTATDLGAAGVDEIYGWGLLDLRKAINGPGQIRVDTDVVMDQRAGGAKVWEGDAWDDWSNDIGGPGRLTKSGIGWLRLSGDNAFGGLTVNDGVLELTGANQLADTVVNGGWALVADSGSLSNAVTVNGGVLTVDGLHTGALTVNAQGTLNGHGTVGDTTLAGTLAPGNSLGTLTVDGDYVQLDGSVYVTEFGAAHASDRLVVTGSADLQGGTVQVVRAPGEYLLGRSYTILTAAGGIDGAFDGIDGSLVSPFLAFDFSYGANAVALDVSRGMALAEAAQTRNQLAVASAADALGNDAQLLQVLTQLFPAEAVGAFDALSGEYHASVRSLLVDGSRQIRDVALDRALPLASPAAAQAGDGPAAWVQVFGAGGELDGDGNAAALDYNGHGTLVGVDQVLAGGWRIGALGGIERSDVALPDRASEGDVKTRHLGIYAGKRWNSLGLRAGAAYARHEVDSERTVVFPGIDQYLMDEYRGHTTQLFVEGGYRFDGDDWSVEPYAQYAHVEVGTDRIREQGGSVALSGDDADSSVGLATVGVRFDLGLSGAQQSASWLKLRGGLGWRHASGDVTPHNRVAWSGGQAFTVAGAPIADSAMLVETGVAAWLSPRTLLELGYNGQFADEARDHGFTARLSMQF